MRVWMSIVLCWLSPSIATANGAFPDSLGLLLAADRPEQIILSTNFGLLRSDDAGASWGWVCEEAIGFGGYIYQLGPAPDSRLFAVTSEGLRVSDDAGCTWSGAQGLLNPSDAFADATDARRVLAIAQAENPAGGPALKALFESSDRGDSFEERFTATSGAFLSSVEIARSAPSVVYLAMSTYVAPQWQPAMARSDDDGQNFVVHELSKQLGALVPYILSIDPANADRVYLRLQGSMNQEAFGVYDAMSMTADPTLQLASRMSAFLLRSDGALIVATWDGPAFISLDRGSSFAPWPSTAPNTLHLRALAEREGRIYAAADDLQDGFALAVSDDQGTTWQPLLSFANIGGPMQCGEIPQQCEVPWETLQTTLAMPPMQMPEPGPADAGLPDAGGVQSQPSSTSGCGCVATRTSGQAPTLDGLAVASAAVYLLWRRRPRTARRRRACAGSRCQAAW
jgi:hypothetical protein